MVGCLGGVRELENWLLVLEKDTTPTNNGDAVNNDNNYSTVVLPRSQRTFRFYISFGYQKGPLAR